MPTVIARLSIVLPSPTLILGPMPIMLRSLLSSAFETLLTCIESLPLVILHHSVKSAQALLDDVIVAIPRSVVHALLFGSHPLSHVCASILGNKARQRIIAETRSTVDALRTGTGKRVGDEVVERLVYSMATGRSPKKTQIGLLETIDGL